MIEKGIKILLSVLLLLCLLKMQYGYYQLIRFLSTGVFLYFAFIENERGNRNNVFIYAALAALFQPFFKINLGREIWNIVDVIVAFYLLYTVFFIRTTRQ
jgi:hypothetical protein